MIERPNQVLRAQGIDPAGIADEELLTGKDGRPYFVVDLPFARQGTMIALAHLIAGGWRIQLDPEPDSIRVRLRTGSSA